MAGDQRDQHNLVSLFSGCGAGDLGFRGGFEFLGTGYEGLPFKTVWANDIDKFACHVYRVNLGNQIHCGDITKIRFERLEFDTEDIDVLLSGLPCQEFSLTGPRRGLHTPRGQLYKYMRKALRLFRPKVFLAENVPGIEYPPSILNTITVGLAGRIDPRYRVTCYRVNGADYGVPQLRKRVLIIGIRSDLPNSFVPPTVVRCGRNGPPVDFPRWLTSREAIEDLWNPEGVRGHAIPDQEKLTEATIALALRGRRDRRLDPDMPAPTIRAEHHGHVEVHYNKSSDGSLRRLTIRECARIQGFPDTFAFPVSATQAYRQIGNAMPPVMMHHWAASVHKWLHGDSYA